jgi:DNA-binding transcriptional LysR family regulator
LGVDVRQLRYFVVLAEELHFGRAASKLHIAQPALSQHIKSLETELGLRLVERTSRGVVLTDAGSRLLTEARAVVGRFNEALETMRKVKEGSIGALRVGVFPGPLRDVLPPALVELRKRQPELDVETRFLPTGEQLGALLDSRLDVALLRRSEDSTLRRRSPRRPCVVSGLGSPCPPRTNSRESASSSRPTSHRCHWSSCRAKALRRCTTPFSLRCEARASSPDLSSSRPLRSRR